MADFVLWVFVAGLVLFVLWTLFKTPSKTQKTTPDIPPSRPSTKMVYDATNKQRRRRNSGGFYPVGYDGPYEDGEELVEYLIWSAVLDEMENDGVERENYFEQLEDGGVEPEPELYVEPESTSYEPDPEPEPSRSSWGGSSDDSSSGWGGSDDSDSGGWDDD